MNYKRIHDLIIDNARERGIIGGYLEKHHIIPKCLGGNNSKSNIVFLTAKEHYLIHFLLTKIYPNENGLIYSFWMMCNGSKKNRPAPSARLYEEGRKMFSSIMKGKASPRLNAILSEDTKKKISTSKKGQTSWRGKNHTSDTKLKMSESAKKRKIVEENEALRREKISIASKKPKSADHSNNIAKAKMGKNNPMFGSRWKLIDGKRVYFS